MKKLRSVVSPTTSASIGWVKDGQPEKDVDDKQFSEGLSTLESALAEFHAICEKIKDQKGELEGF